MTRTYGTGTLREVRPGVWLLRVMTTDRDGRRRQVGKTFRTKARGGKTEAAKELVRFAAELEEHRSPSAHTFASLAEEWMAQLRRQGRAPSTLETYASHLERHIVPALGDKRLDQIGPRDLDQLYGSLTDAGMAPGTVRVVHAVVSGALRQAMRWEWLEKSPAELASPPRLAPEEPHSLSAQELGVILRAASVDDPDLAALIALGALTGARRGELCGLRWDDVDRERQTIRIERAWVAGKGGQHLGPPKGRKARTVALGTMGLGVIEAYRVLQVERWHREPAGWLLSYDGGTTPLRAKAVSEYISSLGKRLGIPVHTHSLRHFTATELLGAGVDLATAAARLGHSRAMLAEVYAHSSDERAAAAAEIMGAVIAGELPLAQRKEGDE